MKCPFCSYADNKVVDKREAEDLVATRRRRECLKCGRRFTTYERVETLDITVIKKDGKKETYSREKLHAGLEKALRKRPITPEEIEDVAEKIEAEIRKKGGTEILSSQIGEMVMKRLKKLDEVAYLRFASVYKEFEGLESFKQELDKLKEVTKK